MPFDPSSGSSAHIPGPGDTLDGLPVSPEVVLISSPEEQRVAREQLLGSPRPTPSRAPDRRRRERVTPAAAALAPSLSRRWRRRIVLAPAVALGVAALFVGGMVAAGLVPLSAAAGDPVIAAAGDICATATDCSPSANLLDALNPDSVLLLGDNAYPDGSLSQYRTYYDPNWGRQNTKVFPAPGNHEFHTANAQGYRDYFGARAPALWYSFDLGAWHIVSLAGDQGVSASAGSAQEQFLKADLAAHASTCTLVYFHEPRFSSGTTHGSDSGVAALWNDMYAAGVDLVLNGHEHNYERFAKQNPSGVADPNGIREIVAGIGGAEKGAYPFGTPIANSQVRGQVDGVLKVTLHPGGYEWQVLPVAGQSFTDSGSDTCSAANSVTTSTTTSTGTTTGPTTTTTPTSTTAPPPSSTTTTSTAPTTTTTATSTTTPSSTTGTTTTGTTTTTNTTTTATTATSTSATSSTPTTGTTSTGTSTITPPPTTSTTTPITTTTASAPTPTTTTTTTAPLTTTTDTTPPTAPTDLRVTSGSKTSLALVWTPSFDDVGVAGYRVWRGSAVVGIALSPIWFDSGLKCAKTYTYSIGAIDLAGNVSPRATYTAVCSFN